MREETCRIFGEKVYFFRIGNKKSAKKIVILHGWDPTKRVSKGFLPLAEILAKKLRAEIIIPDLPGFGKSPLPQRKYIESNYGEFCENPRKAGEIMQKGWSVWDYSDWLEEFLDKLNLENPILYGHSFGCRIISRFLIRNQNFAGKIILTSAAGIRLPLSLRQRFSQILAKTFPLAKKIIPRKIQKFVVKKLFGARDWGNCPAEMKETFQKVIAEPCIRENLKEIKNEVLLIWGKQDTITPLEAGRIFRQKLKNSSLKVLSTGRHGIHHTHTEKIAEIVMEFLKN